MNFMKHDQCNNKNVRRKRLVTTLLHYVTFGGIPHREALHCMTAYDSAYVVSGYPRLVLGVDSRVCLLAETWGQFGGRAVPS